jgi:hypothetical protein
VDSCDNIASLELLVDCALYVDLIDADVSKLKVAELYTDIGEQDRSHAKITISYVFGFFTAQLVTYFVCQNFFREFQLGF